ncbi:MAG TPA: glycosyltransferase, partial [Paracoccaceae bacterium]|nr:glycosyltransferase [Paracoccaceae bacterium]
MADSLARHPPRRLGEILVDQGAIDRARLEEVLAAQRRTSLRLGELLVARSMVTRGQVSEALAAQWSLGHVDLRAAPPDPALLEGCDPAACLAAQCIPWRRVGGNILVALADPDRKEAALAATGLPSDGIAFAMADKAEIREAIAQAFREKLRDRALIRTPAPHSCRDWGRFSAPLGIGLAGFLGAFLVAAGPFALATLMLGWAILANCATTLLRLAALAISCLPGAAPPPEDLPRLARFRRLPVVSILVPLYRETAVIDPLLAALARLDYPRELLDIILVLEEDDAPMLDALAVRTLPPSVRTLAVPADRLRTKPRAMNYALDFADGEIIGVYDAEDRPAPDQVTRIVEMFAESPPKVACVQARLGFYNAGQNWLARCFAIEYATWFEILLRGYDRLGLPIPLGGTSVFFRRAALEAVGVWDAYNVTEDADLGMRLARFGYVT